MKKIRTWQLCRTGTFGQDGAIITEKDLREIEETFTPTRPISIGHDAARSDSFPKFGDVLAVDGIYDDPAHKGEKVLVGKVTLHPALESQFDDGSGDGVYKGWSVTIPRRASDGKRYLHSLAICGAVPPKIAGLEQLMVKSCYSDGDSVEVFDFNDAINYQGVISMTDEEKEKMESLEAEIKKLKEELEKNSGGGKSGDGGKEPQDFKKSAEYADMLSEIAELKSAKREALVKSVSGRFQDRIPQGLRAKAEAVAGILAGAEPCEFSDSDGKSGKEAALDVFADLLDGLLSQSRTDVTRQQFNASAFSDAGKETDWAKIAASL